ncbi:hypothetical protein OAQ96_01885 [Alphaproteobacteria bacterium]|nr:hypothetical protein [Alphaproteobacteria bacterium]
MDKINIIGLTQGSNIDILLKLIQNINNKKNNSLNLKGAYVSLARHFEKSKIIKDNKKKIIFLKEWEIFQSSKKIKVENHKIIELSSRFGSNKLWQCIIGDRRLIYGKNCKSIQDYNTRFSDEFIYNLIYRFCETFSEFINLTKPDIVLGFTPVTFGELIAQEILKQKNIPILQLHSSRISNYFAFHDNLLGTSDHIKRIMNDPKKISLSSFNKADEFIKKIKETGIIYEGVNIEKKKFKKDNIFKSLYKLPSVIKNEIVRYSNSTFRNDHHDNGHLLPWYYEDLVQRKRAIINDKFLKLSNRTYKINDLDKIKFAFYPLHSEPEVALQVLGFPYHKNQIELIRSIAASLPLGMRLIVKEHPRSYGMRPKSFYKSLLEIPNLYFSEKEIKPIEIVKLAKLVFVISSTIGLEAAIVGKPLIILGYPKYLSIPNTMFKQSLNLFELGSDVEKILNNYVFDYKNLKNYIAAQIEGGVDINLYSILLKKPNRYSFLKVNEDIKIKEAEDYVKLAEYTISRINEELKINNEKIN